MDPDQSSMNSDATGMKVNQSGMDSDKSGGCSDAIGMEENVTRIEENEKGGLVCVSWLAEK